MRAIVKVVVGGTDITDRLLSRLISLTVNDQAGQTSDTASLVLDDTDGQIVMPQPGAQVEVFLGWEGRGVGPAFTGVVDEISASGGREGRTLTVGAKGMDTRGPAKEPRRLHLDDTTIGEAMSRAGRLAGIDVRVDPALAALARRYLALDDESFAAFGERIAREVGGTFKIVGTRAILALRNGGVGVGGAALPEIRAAWGENLHRYDIAPILSRNAEQKVAVRYYDLRAAAWRLVEAATGTEGARTIRTAIMPAPDAETAQARARSDAQEADRKSGEGQVVIEGNIAAQPEGLCRVTGCRPGVDGTYRIEAVTHEYGRSSGFLTTLTLKQPKGAAGRDTRR
jgi:phage protein D